LTSCIPDIKLRWFAFEGDIFDPEINCGDLGAFLGLKLTLDKSPKECSFANITITNKNKLVFFFFTK
jgi:hypothetical protein